MLRKFCLIVFFLTSPAYAVKNAGILPYAYKDGKAYFLFGLEDRYWDTGAPWAKKAQSTWVWIDFGGKCDTEDTKDASNYNTNQATLCAAREGTEETRYIFGNTLPLKSGLTNKSLEYKNSVNYFIKRVTGSFSVDVYEEFFVNVDYIDAQKINNSPTVPNDEKTEWRWILVDDVLKALEKTQDEFFRFNFTHQHTNKIFPYLAMTLKRQDVQNFIKNIILTRETPIQPKDNLKDLLSSITNLNNALTQLMQQLQALG